MAESTPSQAEIRKTVKEYIVREILSDENSGDLDDSVQLITNGMLDSIKTVQMVAYLEELYSIEFEGYEMTSDLLDTLPDIARVVHSKISQA